MNKITEFLNLASRHYYAGEPIISDEQFDALAHNVGYSAVGARQHDNVKKHYRQMYSLQKHYEDEGIHPLSDQKDKCVSPKLDGAAISLLYIDGLLVQALTRGDGVEGRDITEKFLSTSLVPKQLNTLMFPKVFQVTGEVAAPKHVENARNYAAGALNLGSIEEFKSRSIEFFAYGVFPFVTNKYDGDMLVLKQAGFNTVQDSDIEKIYPTDGLVFRVNDNKTFVELGYTSKHPRGAYALKVRQETIETTLLGVEWQVSKSGRINPVAILEPVFIEDALISRATLNNQDFIKALDLRLGDRVAIRRAGSIIPEIVHKVE